MKRSHSVIKMAIGKACFVIANNLNIREIDFKASWGRSSSYAHGMLRGRFNPSPARIVEVERIIAEMIEEKTRGKRSQKTA